MYFVGKSPLNIERNKKMKKLLPGAEVPEAKDFPDLRRMLSNGEVHCDYKNGETPPHEMAPITRSSVVTPSQILKALTVAGVEVPPDATFKEMSEAYDILLLFKENKDFQPPKVAWVAKALEPILEKPKKKKG